MAPRRVRRRRPLSSARPPLAISSVRSSQVGRPLSSSTSPGVRSTPHTPWGREPRMPGRSARTFHTEPPPFPSKAHGAIGFSVGCRPMAACARAHSHDFDSHPPTLVLEGSVVDCRLWTVLGAQATCDQSRGGGTAGLPRVSPVLDRARTASGRALPRRRVSRRSAPSGVQDMGCRLRRPPLTPPRTWECVTCRSGSVGRTLRGWVTRARPSVPDLGMGRGRHSIPGTCRERQREER